MRNAIVLLSLLAGTQLMAAELLLPDTYLTHCGIYQHTNTEVVRELTIETNKLWFNASTGDHTCSSGSYNWTAAHPSWFVYIAKDMRVWAYDGDQYLTLLEANAQRGEKHFIAVSGGAAACRRRETIAQGRSKTAPL